MFVIFCPFSLRNTILYNFSKQKNHHYPMTLKPIDLLIQQQGF